MARPRWRETLSTALEFGRLVIAEAAESIQLRDDVRHALRRQMFPLVVVKVRNHESLERLRKAVQSFKIATRSGLDVGGDGRPCRRNRSRGRRDGFVFAFSSSLCGSGRFAILNLDACALRGDP
ncbi:hypothetical protein GGQ85_001456 [Nitrobacter vulgaris]|uniref:Uncharacterized protein n=1 Tax=Nitrobacter vulgaris TaxID=29421 RepID=A0A1V4I252_NITVU|nr:hypothetical protein [Nitrobacter vulgaris]OPH84195.1 hypothetical protein B2M20_02620 [Nitrobacter vulgaris]